MFKEFSEKLQLHLANAKSQLFIANVEKDEMWEAYLKAFPAGTNPIYRERTEHDCSCCRQFIKAVGNVVWFSEQGSPTTIWDCGYVAEPYKTVSEKMSSLIHGASIRDVFIPAQQKYGVIENHEEGENGKVITYHHYFAEFSKKLVKDKDDIPTLQNDKRTTKQVFKRSLDEIHAESVDSVLDLISQNSLYKGEEWKKQLEMFRELQQAYKNADDPDHFAWIKSIEVGPVIGRIRNHSIGTLLVELSAGEDIDVAVTRYEKMVAPTNYKRPKAVFTQKMIDAAQKTLQKMGLEESLNRRFAVLDDITVNDILFANKDTAKKMNGGALGDLKPTTAPSSRKFDKLEEIPVEKFVSDVLPRVSNMEVMLEGRHEGNLVSVIAPVNGAPSLFKWGNGFSWAYNGNITDSIRQNVKKAGGNVEGVLRFSIQWNDGEKHNPNDFDAHAVEPSGGCHISFRNMRSPRTGGNLDVDIRWPQVNEPAVENIVWPKLDRMPEGEYRFAVHNFCYRGGMDGFSAEIEADGETYEYTHEAGLRQDEMVDVARVQLKNGKFTISGLKATSRDIWGLRTQQFHPVSMFMYSPNHWEGSGGIGHRHYFFIINGCRNVTRPNGFFNEFLKEDLMEHKRVFEALGSKMRVEDSDKQLSGIGFSSTKRNHVVCKLEGNTSRMVKVVF